MAAVAPQKILMLGCTRFLGLQAKLTRWCELQGGK